MQAARKFNIFKIIWFLPVSDELRSDCLPVQLRSGNQRRSLFLSRHSVYQGQQSERGPSWEETRRALFSVIGVMAWQFTPFYMVYFIAGYGNIDTSLYEAAVIDGATRKQYLFKIAIPLLGPIFKTACTMSLIGSLKYFDMVWNMTGGGPAGGTELMATYMYKLSFQQFNMGYGSCVAAGMFILITLIALLFQKIFVVKEDY